MDPLYGTLRTARARRSRAESAHELLSRSHELGQLPVRRLIGSAMAESGNRSLVTASPITRRSFFQCVSGGIYAAALAWCQSQESPLRAAEAYPTDLRP